MQEIDESEIVITDNKNELTTNQVVELLTQYFVIPYEEWLHSYHHMYPPLRGGSPQASRIMLRSKYELDVVALPGGLAFINEEESVIYLARELQEFMKKRKAQQ